MRSYCTSVLHAKDMVTRISLANTTALMEQMLWLLSRCGCVCGGTVGGRKGGVHVCVVGGHVFVWVGGGGAVCECVCGVFLWMVEGWLEGMGALFGRHVWGAGVEGRGWRRCSP